MKVQSLTVIVGLMSMVIPATSAAELTDIATLTGSCERLVMAGNDQTDHCDSKILQSIYDSSRTGWTIAVGDNGAVYTFSGMHGAKPDENSQLQSVDNIILSLGIKGVDPTSVETQGGCSYSNPYLGPMQISCQAVDDEGKAYLLQFRTDGRDPAFADLRGSADAQSAADEGEVVVDNGRFAIGQWEGGPLTEGDVGGCLMSAAISPRIMLLVYANANEAFEINILNEAWSYDLDETVDGELLFDGVTYPATRTVARTPQILTIFGGGEEDGYQILFRESAELQFRMKGQQITAKLTKSAAAATALWDCVNAP